MAPLTLLLIFLGINAFTYLAYAADKHYARRGGWRVPETTLHLLALAGGSPAAFIAQRRLRHKTRKTPFQVRYWLIVTLQMLGLAYYALSGGGIG